MLDVHGEVSQVQRGEQHAVLGKDEEIHLRAVRATVVQGRVVDPDGAPAANARVLLFREGAGDAVAGRARTDAGGTFRLRGCFAGDDARLVARGPGHAASGPFRLEEGREIVVPELQLQPAATIEGELHDAAGTVPGAFVQLVPRDGQVHGEYPQVATDRAGRFRFLDVAPGQYVMRARFGTTAEGRAVEKTTTLHAGASQRWRMELPAK